MDIINRLPSDLQPAFHLVMGAKGVANDPDPFGAHRKPFIEYIEYDIKGEALKWLPWEGRTSVSDYMRGIYDRYEQGESGIVDLVYYHNEGIECLARLTFSGHSWSVLIDDYPYLSHPEEAARKFTRGFYIALRKLERKVGLVINYNPGPLKGIPLLPEGNL